MEKGLQYIFYHFHSNPERRERWIAAVKRENWHPTEHTWLCSEHFIRKHKSENPLSPDYVPSVFEYVGSPIKRKLNKKPLIKWPTQEQLKKTIPSDFKGHFNKSVCIIDCLEVFCERPSDLKARALIYSNYKHHNTVKVLIGITPQGVISYVSKGWGGRVSDKHLTENCGKGASARRSSIGRSWLQCASII